METAQQIDSILTQLFRDLSQTKYALDARALSNNASPSEITSLVPNCSLTDMQVKLSKTVRFFKTLKTTDKKGADFSTIVQNLDENIQTLPMEPSNPLMSI